MSNRADLLNKERWDQQRSASLNGRLDRIIELLECMVQMKLGEKKNE